jgi:predicted ATPase
MVMGQKMTVVISPSVSRISNDHVKYHPNVHLAQLISEVYRKPEVRDFPLVQASM